MKNNNVIITGATTRVTPSKFGERDFLSLTVAVPTGRTREDGSKITTSISVSLGGPAATRLKDKLQVGHLICVEGSFEPYQDKNNNYRFPVNATSITLVDAGELNCAQLYGRLTSDPEIRKTAQSRVANIRIAVSRRYQDKNKEWQEVTSYITVNCWGALADTIGGYHKGDAIWILGHLTARKWTDKEGNDHFVTEVVADSVHPGGTGKHGQFTDDASASANGNGNGYAVPASAPADFPLIDDLEDAELPF